MSADISAAPDLSIITVCRNASDTLERCISSVQPLLQNHPVRTEYIVIDGASTDGTADMLRRAQETGRITRSISEPDSGIYDAMNKGLRLAAGKVCVFINADDEICPEAVEACCRPILDGEADYTVSTARMVNKEGTFLQLREADYNLRWIGVVCCHQSLYCRTELLQQMEGFDTTLRIAADTELIGRLIARRARWQKVDVVSSVFHMGGASEQSCMYGEQLAVVGRFSKEIINAGKESPVYAMKALRMLIYHLSRFLLVQEDGGAGKDARKALLLHRKIAETLPAEKRAALKKRYRRKAFTNKFLSLLPFSRKARLRRILAGTYDTLSQAC